MHLRTLRHALALVLPAVATGCGGAEPQRALDPGQAALRRLTPTEYNNSIRDLFGHRSADDWYDEGGRDPDGEEDEEAEGLWPQTLPPEVKVHGFEGFRSGQVASPYLAERYQTVAAHFGRLAPRAPRFWTCDVDALDGAAARVCAKDSLLRFASRAYRRDLTVSERSELLTFVEANLEEAGLVEGVALSVAGVLGAPQFLYLAEPSDSGPADWEMASRLSYFLYDSLPDAALFEAASQGRLKTEAEVEFQVRRMLGDWRARARRGLCHPSGLRDLHAPVHARCRTRGRRRVAGL